MLRLDLTNRARHPRPVPTEGEGPGVRRLLLACNRRARRYVGVGANPHTPGIFVDRKGGLSC